jgi:hypothetical protein
MPLKYIDNESCCIAHFLKAMLNHNFAFTPAELRKLRALSTPHKIQCFLDEIPYHLAATAWSPRRVLAERTAHCLEGAIFAAAALRANGYPPLVMDMEAERDTDHVIAIYRVGGHWGAIAKSNYSGCRGRQPIYRTLRELALSYFEDYFSMRRHYSMRTYSRPVNLARFDHLNWMTSEKSVWFIPEYLCDIFHYKLLRRGMVRRLVPADRRTLEAGVVGRKWE